MNRARYDFLAGAGLAREQHGRVGGRYGLHLGEDFAQAPAAPHDRLQESVFGALKLAHIGFIETTKRSPPSRCSSISVNVRGKVGHYAHVSPPRWLSQVLVTMELVRRPEFFPLPRTSTLESGIDEAFKAFVDSSMGSSPTSRYFRST